VKVNQSLTEQSSKAKNFVMTECCPAQASAAITHAAVFWNWHPPLENSGPLVAGLRRSQRMELTPQGELAPINIAL
jgi:hypothetical protein